MPDVPFVKTELTDSVTLTFKRSKVVTETGSVTIPLTEEALAALKEYRNLDAWAVFTAIREVKNWKEPEKIALLEWSVVEWDAEFSDGTKIAKARGGAGGGSKL